MIAAQGGGVEPDRRRVALAGKDLARAVEREQVPVAPLRRQRRRGRFRRRRGRPFRGVIGVRLATRILVGNRLIERLGAGQPVDETGQPLAFVPELGRLPGRGKEHQPAARPGREFPPPGTARRHLAMARQLPSVGGLDEIGAVVAKQVRRQRRLPEFPAGQRRFDRLGVGDKQVRFAAQLEGGAQTRRRDRLAAGQKPHPRQRRPSHRPEPDAMRDLALDRHRQRGRFQPLGADPGAKKHRCHIAPHHPFAVAAPQPGGALVERQRKNVRRLVACGPVAGHCVPSPRTAPCPDLGHPKAPNLGVV